MCYYFYRCGLCGYFKYRRDIFRSFSVIYNLYKYVFCWLQQVLQSDDEVDKYVVTLNGYVERGNNILMIVKDAGKFMVKKTFMEEQLGSMDSLILPMKIKFNVVGGAVTDLRRND